MSLGLLGAYQSGSESDSDGSSGDENNAMLQQQEAKIETPPEEVLENPFCRGQAQLRGASLLPKPSFLQDAERISGVKFDNDSSVFSNPFREKEDKKKAILEQHVNMTQKQEDLKVINGKKVCWMFRKGRCRHGHNCSFAHDTDVKMDKNLSPVVKSYDADSQIASEKSSGTGRVIQLAAPVREPSPPQADEDEQKPRKKRPGLSEGVVPSKKAMTFHNKVYNNKL